MTSVRGRRSKGDANTIVNPRRSDQGFSTPLIGLTRSTEKKRKAIERREIAGPFPGAGETVYSKMKMTGFGPPRP